MKILVLAPHVDDEVLGVGGTIAKLAAEGHSVIVAVPTGPGEGDHPLWPKEAWIPTRAECRRAAEVLGVHEVIFRDLPAAMLESTPVYKVNKVVQDVINLVNPDEMYIPFSQDLHFDHKAIAYAAMVASRPYLEQARGIRRVLAYETLSETFLAAPYLEATFQPNVFVNITKTLDTKCQAMACYESQLQADNQPRSIAAIRALATIRGTHIGCEAGEAFLLLGEYQR